MKETPMSYSILKKVKQTRFKKLVSNSLWLVSILAFSLLLMACSKTEEPKQVINEEESALSIPYATGPSNPPEVNIPNTNPPKN